MSNLAVLGLEGRDDLWIVDLDALTVTKVDGGALGMEFSAAKTTDDPVMSGGINLAATAQCSDEAASFQSYKGPVGKATDGTVVSGGINLAVMAQCSDEAASFQSYKQPAGKVADRAVVPGRINLAVMAQCNDEAASFAMHKHPVG